MKIFDFETLPIWEWFFPDPFLSGFVDWESDQYEFCFSKNLSEHKENFLRFSEKENFIFFNASFELGVLSQKLGIDLHYSQYRDPMLMHCILYPDHRHNLISIAEQFNLDNSGKNEVDDWLKAHGFKKGEDIFQAPKELILKRNEADCRLTKEIYKILWKEIKKAGLEETEKRERIFQWIMVRCQLNNPLKVDVKSLEFFKRKLITINKIYEKEIFSFYEREFNIRSNVEFAQVTGYEHRSNEKIYENIFPNNPVIARYLMQWNTNSETIKTIETWEPSFLMTKNKINTSWLSHGTVTGRPISNSPNLQNIIKIKNAYAKHPHYELAGVKLHDLRRFMQAETNDKSLVSMDFSQQEPRILAWLGKGNIHNGYQNDPDFDIYNKINESLFDGNREKRYIIKQLVLSIIYFLGKEALARKLNISVVEAMELKKKFLYLNPDIQKVIYDFRNIRTFQTIGGRRYVFEDENTYWSLNYFIQGSAADLTKMAVINLYEKGLLDIIKLHLIVYDEIIFSIEKKDLSFIKDIERELCDLPIKMKVETEIKKENLSE